MPVLQSCAIFGEKHATTKLFNIEDFRSLCETNATQILFHSMKTISAAEREQLIGSYTAPLDLYEYIKSLPFLGTVTTDVRSLIAGQWAEITIVYTVGASGLADGAWIKGTFKFYSASLAVFPSYWMVALIRTGLGLVPNI
jgi:hypothetical protein